MADRTVRVRVVAEMPGLAAQLRAAGADVRSLGTAARTAGGGVRALGADATAAERGLVRLATGARGGAAGLTEAEAAAAGVGRGVRSAAAQAEASGGAFDRIKKGAAGLVEQMRGLGLLLAGGAVFMGLKDIVTQGNEYNDAMNKFLEVTRASGAQMTAAGAEAQALGADMKLPTASAAEAADAMVELAKAGLSAQDAIKAARGTIQLAAAARTDVATAAQIEGDVLDEFAMKATDAGKVADVLANTANSASGQLMDIYYAMKYVGPTAHSMGVSLSDLATAIGLLGKSGIIGETAGTAIRSALVNMAKPTKQATKGLKELGIQAFDKQGNFKGLEYVITQLNKAQQHLTTQQFTAASAMAFGKPALSAMIALAHQGPAAWNQFALSVNRAGGAASLAAAESKGLGGAMRSLGKELTSAFLQVYLGISPMLESVTRDMATTVSAAIPYLKRGIKTATDLWDIYGPGVEKKLASATSGIKAEAQLMVKPLEAGLTGLAVTTVPLAVTGFDALGKTLGNVEAAAKPVASGFADMFQSVASGSGALGTLEGRLQVGVGLLGDASAVLRPLGSLVGGLAHAFAGLPGPIQLSAISMLAMRPFRPQIQGMQQSVVAFGRSGIEAFRGIGDASLYQRVQAANAGVMLSRFGGYVEHLAQAPGTIGAMATAFRGVYSGISPAASSMERFSGSLRGLRAAGAVGALSGLKSAASGLLGVFGGPWGLAIGGAMSALDYFSQKDQEAKQAVDDFTTAIQQDSGAIGDNTRQLIANKLEKAGALDTARKYGIQLSTLEDAATGNTAALKAVNAALMANGASYQFAGREAQNTGKTQTRFLPDAQKLKNTLGDLNKYLTTGAQAFRNQQQAIDGTSISAAQAVTPTGRLQLAITTLSSKESDAASKADALHTALQLLSGGELDVEAATAQMNGAILNLTATWKDGVDKTQGYGKQLLQLDGSLNTTTQNGQTLWNQLQNLNTETAAAAEATYNYAIQNGSTVPQALAQAEKSMQTAWSAAVTAGEKFGLSADQAKNLAAQMGFIPSNLAITLDMKGADQTERDLLYVQGLADHLPKGAQIKVSALTAQATKDIESVGFKVKTLPGGRQVIITVPSARAFHDLAAIQSGIDSVHGKTVQVTINGVATGVNPSQYYSQGPHVGNANGAVYRAFATGGVERHEPQIAPAGAWRVWAEPETGGEAYIPLGAGKRRRSKLQVEEVVREFGGAVHWFAGGGIERFASGGFSYTPFAPMLGGTDDAMSRYIAAVSRVGADWKALTADLRAQAKAAAAVRSAEENLARVRSHRHTYAQLIAAEHKLTQARNAERSAVAKSAGARRTLNAADWAAGLRAGSGAPAGIDLHAYEKQLAASLSATETWRRNLAAVGTRGGAEIEQLLAGMGSSGEQLTAALARASKRDFDTIIANLQRVSDQAKATLADFDQQVSRSAQTNSQFAADLTSLAARGYGSLAQQLASEGDQNAIDLAREAAGASGSELAKINADVTAQQNTLTGADLNNLLIVLTTLRAKPGRGFADVEAAGVAAADLVALVPKILPEIEQLPQQYRATFLAQWAGQSQTGVAMARGGILADGADVVRFAERGTGGEAYIPLGPGNRGRSTELLQEVAQRFGYQLMPMQRFAYAAGAAGAAVQQTTNNNTVHLHGARQTAAEQAMDIARHMAFVG